MHSKPITYALAIGALSLTLSGLFGCGGASETPSFEDNPPPNLSDESGNQASFIIDTTNPLPEANTRILFNPAQSVYPSKVNDLLFLNTTDGTAATEVVDPVITPAINDIDGFSTMAQIDFEFDGPILDSSICSLQDISLLAQELYHLVPPARLAACSTQGRPNLFIVPLTLAEGADPLDPSKITGVDLAKMATLNYKAEVVTLDCDNGVDENGKNCQNRVLRITPLSPLHAKTKFLVAFTDGIMDDPDHNGNGEADEGEVSMPVGPSVAYHAIGEPPHPNDSIEALNQLMNGLESVVLGISEQQGFQLTANNIVYTQTVTTTQPTEVLTALAAPLAHNPNYALLERFLPSAAPRDTSFYKQTPLGPGQSGHLGAPSENNPTGMFSAPSIIVEGAIKLPYFLIAPAHDAAQQDIEAPLESGSRGDVILDTSWTASTEIGAIIDSSNGLPANSTPPADSDGTHNVTYRFPFPEQTGEEVVPMTVMLPNLQAIAATATTYPESAAADIWNNMADQENPSWPTVVYAVGLTTDRSINLLAANALAGACLSPTAPRGTQCFATVTIDHPVHGLSAAGPRIPGVLSNVDQLPPENLETGFEGLRERHFGYTANAYRRPIPMDYENGIGSSGSLGINLANFQNTRDKLRQSVVDHLNLLASLEQISITQESVTHSLNSEQVNFVGHSLGGLMGLPLVATNNSPDVQANSEHLPFIQAAALLNTSGGLGKLVENMPDIEFGAAVSLSGLAASTFNPETGEYALRQGTRDLETFFYYFQTTMDTVDPINFAGSLASTTTAILATEIIGGLDQASDPRDQTIPLAADADIYKLAGDYSDLGLTAPFKHQNAGRCPLPEDPELGCLIGGVSAPLLPDTTALPAPLVGTEAVIAGLGLTPVDSITAGTEPLKVAVRFTDGEHGTAVSPINPFTGEAHIAEFKEIITQLVSFFSSRGTQIAVGTVSDKIYSVSEE